MEAPEKQLMQLFGSYKAEWLNESVFEFFTEPSYFPELTTPHPCILLGGRGTGKTTVLRCLSYEGRYALSDRTIATIEQWAFVGLYYRVNTNRVSALKGNELTTQEWARYFAHYLNLLMCSQVISFLNWREGLIPGAQQLNSSVCEAVSKSLNIAPARTHSELSRSLKDGIIAFESAINNIADDSISLRLSLQGAPVDLLVSALRELPQFQGKHFFFIVDEYENFLDYQQRVVNTLIKHCGEHYSFKIGVKELGWRCRTTVNETEQLQSPADYIKISITDELRDAFGNFALRICNSRMAKISTANPPITQIETILEPLADEDEAKLLDGGSAALTEAENELAKCGQLERVLDASPSMRYLLVYWARTQGLMIEATVEDYLHNRSEWKDRLDNYRHALLYTIRRGRSGIRKYYCGIDTYLQLAGTNIRYFLELVKETLLLHLQAGGSLSKPVSPSHQTLACQEVGRKNLGELEGLSVDGAHLTKLVLGLGRVFGVMAANPEGRRPEVNQFCFPNEAVELDLQAESLLRSGVNHLALIRLPGSKLNDENDTRSYDYMLHPIFSAYFVYSHRRKRKIALTPRELLLLVQSPRLGITEILMRSGRSNDEPLPEQLELFRTFYEST
jgi:hypothetical protein